MSYAGTMDYPISQEFHRVKGCNLCEYFIPQVGPGVNGNFSFCRSFGNNIKICSEQGSFQHFFIGFKDDFK